MNRAVIFDLDGTLYPERQFIRSGFRVVAAEVERRLGVPREAGLGSLLTELRHGNRARAFQELCRRYSLPAEVIPDLVDVVREHAPHLRLPADSAETLRRARSRGWRIGVLTNGIPAVQARKAAALGLHRFVDEIVFAHAIGSGKPSSEGFEAVLARLDAAPADSVFVGDDPYCDVQGGRGAGLRTILVRRAGTMTPLPPVQEPDLLIQGMDEVIPAVERLWGMETTCVV